MKHTAHGGSRTSLYKRWQMMKDRCINPNNAYYYTYGGRGISVCDEWLESFEPFMDWANLNGYDEALQLDRIDNDKGYSPDNCRWVTSMENTNNRSVTIKFPSGRTTKEVAKALGMSVRSVVHRVNSGMPLDIAETLPKESLAQRNKNKYYMKPLPIKFK